MNAATQRDTTTASQGDSPESRWAGQGNDPDAATSATSVLGLWTDVSDLVLCARCELALACVEGPIDLPSAFVHARSARIWAHQEGRHALTGAALPLLFEDSQTLINGWHSGQRARREGESIRAGAPR